MTPKQGTNIQKKGGFQVEAPFFYLILLIFFRQFAAQCQICHWSCKEQRTESTNNYTENHCKCKATDAVTTKDEDTQQYYQCTYRSIDGTRQSCIQRFVKQLEAVTLRIQSTELTDTVEHYHLIVDRVTDCCQDCTDECLVDFQ